MSEFELASLFYQVLEAAHAALANFLTVVFAVVVVTWFVAAKLDRISAAFLLIVYTLFCLGMTNEIVGLYSDLVRLGWDMANYPGAPFAWHGMARSLVSGPAWVIPAVVTAMCLLAYVGSLIFFHRTRKQRDGLVRAESSSG